MKNEEANDRINFLPIKHGISCKKVVHLGGGYLHDADDDSPYEVDMLVYCGRCHEWLGNLETK